MDPLLQRALEIANRPRRSEPPVSDEFNKEAVTVEPACRPDGSSVSPVYFERKDGFICGPAKVLDFMRASAGGPMRDWLVVEYQGLWEWVLSDRLRTRKQFETQKPLREIELVREAKL
jgi:hypothetical protein